MANEAVLVLETQPAISFLCANGTGIEQGAICKLANPMTASISDGDADYVAGIVKTEKIANDGKTKVSLYREGIFKIYVSGSVTAGQAVMTSSSTNGANICVASTASAVGSKTLGIALDNHSGASSQIRIELKPGCNNTAYS